MSRVETRLQARGFEVQLGALHAFRPGRPSLACDLVEPLRVPTVDRWLLSWLPQSSLTSDQFSHLPRHAATGQPAGVRLPDGAFPVVLRAWEEHWERGAFDERLAKLIGIVEQFLQQHGEPLVRSRYELDPEQDDPPCIT